LREPRCTWTGWGRSGVWNPNAGKRRRLRRGLSLESLESRRLLATVTEYPMNAGGDPTQITVGPDNNLWVTEPTANALGIFSPSTHTQTASSPVNLNLTGANPPGIAATGTGSNGSIWFTVASGAFQLGKSSLSNPSSPTVTNCYLGNIAPSAGITTSSNGAVIWVAVPSQNAILEINAANSALTKSFPLSPANINVANFSSQITVGPDGNIWFTEPGAIGILTPSTGTVTQVSLPNTGGTQIPAAITVGPDGNIWFTESVPNAGGTAFVSSSVGVINTTTHKYVTEFATPASSQPDGITAGPDGNIWFTESAAGAIGIVSVNSTTDPTQDILAPSLSIPTNVVSNPDPKGITIGPDGNIWFADSAGAIGVVTGRIPVVNGAPAVADLGFQTPYVGVGPTAFKMDPTGSAWTFAGSAGLAGNNSAFTSGNPSAPVGTQVGVIQQAGQISQTIDLPAGVFSLSFAAAQRASNSQTIEVLFDGTPIAFVTPSGTSYTTFTTNNFAATAGANSLVFRGLNPNGGDNSAFIDGLAVSVGNGAVDGGFESPSVGNSFQPDPSGTAWTFTGSAGVAGNNSAFTSANPPAPQGTQVGYIQQTGGMSQSINLVAGIYTVNYAAAQRAGQNQSFEVFFDGTLIAVTTPSSSSYATITTNDFIATTGANTLSFVGLNPHGGDNTAFIDQVVLSVPNTLQDGNFASPNLPASTFQYAPTGTPWTYTGSSGLAANNSGITSGNPPAPAGTQVGFIQQTGKISQTINLAAGTYNVNFAAAQRAGNNQRIEVLVDSQVVGIFTPAGTSYSTLTTGPFTVTGGPHTLAFVGLNPNGGDNTALIDGVAVNQPALQIVPYMQDPDFASPSVGVGISAYQPDPSGSPWTFTGSAGLAGNGSAFTSGNSPAPVGTQVAYIQDKGQISQTINLAAGVYTMSFAAAQRLNNSQTIEVIFDGTQIASVTPSSANYSILTTNDFTATAGANTLTFVGLNPNGGDNTAFIDQVLIASV
jgi:streptogramin lyase